MKNRRYSEFWLLALAGAGLLAAFWLFPTTYPQASLQGTHSRREIIHQAENILDQIKAPHEGLEPVVDFRPNYSLLAFGQVNFGTAEANHLFSRNLPAFFWNVRYGKPSLVKNILSTGASEENVTKALVKHQVGEARVQ
ncbi:MAG: hypothetical protein ACRENG_20270 [bacterium]